jgi:hypothetical protein
MVPPLSPCNHLVDVRVCAPRKFPDHNHLHLSFLGRINRLQGDYMKGVACGQVIYAASGYALTGRLDDNTFVVMSNTRKMSELVARARGEDGEAVAQGGIGGGNGRGKRAAVYGPGPGITDRDVQVELLSILRERPVLTVACRELGIEWRAVNAYRKANPDFGREIDDARAEGFDLLEAQAFDEAMAGGFRSHKLLEFLLKGRKRHVYGDRLDVRSDHRHEVIINLIPPGEAAALGAGAPSLPSDVVDAEVVEGE